MKQKRKEVQEDHVKIRKATLRDAFFIANNLRRADMLDCKDRGYTPVNGVITSFMESEICKVGCIHDKPVCIFGVLPDENCEGSCIVWLLGTPDIRFFKRTFLEYSKSEFMKLIEGYDEAYNLIHKENIIHKRWLQWMGFEIHNLKGNYDYVVYKKD